MLFFHFLIWFEPFHYDASNFFNNTEVLQSPLLQQQWNHLIKVTEKIHNETSNQKRKEPKRIKQQTKSQRNIYLTIVYGLPYLIKLTKVFKLHNSSLKSFRPLKQFSTTFLPIMLLFNTKLSFTKFCHVKLFIGQLIFLIIAEEIVSLNADVLCLQEIDHYEDFCSYLGDHGCAGLFKQRNDKRWMRGYF